MAEKLPDDFKSAAIDSRIFGSIEFSDRPIDRLYSHASYSSQRYKTQIEEYLDNGSPIQMDGRSALHTRDLRNLDDLLKGVAKETGIPLKPQDDSKDAYVSVNDMKAIYAYTDKRMGEYKENYKKLNDNPDEESKFHLSTIVSLDDMMQEARKNADKFVKDGKAGQIEVKNGSLQGVDVAGASAPIAPQGEEGNATKESGVARALPNKAEETAQNAATYASKDAERRAAELDLIVSARGLSNEEKNNVVADVGSKTAGGTVRLGDVVASEQRVTGLPPEVLANATNIAKQLLRTGTNDTNPSEFQVAAISKQQQENGLSA